MESSSGAKGIAITAKHLLKSCFSRTKAKSWSFALAWNYIHQTSQHQAVTLGLLPQMCTEGNAGINEPKRAQPRGGMYVRE
jgi:hypothetical protein